MTPSPPPSSGGGSPVTPSPAPPSGGGSAPPGSAPIQPLDPSSIGGLILSLDASKANSLTSSESETTYPTSGSIADGAAVYLWFDSSTAGNLFGQNVVTDRPIYHATGGHIGSEPYLLFRGSNTKTDGTGPAMFEASGAKLYNTLGGSNTVLMLQWGFGDSQSNYQSMLTQTSGGNSAEWLMDYSGNFTRFSGSAQAPIPYQTAHALVYSYNASNTTEKLYVDSAVAPSATSVSGRPAGGTSAYYLGATAGNHNNCWNAEVYVVLAYNRELSNSEIAEVLAGWNTKYGTSFNVSVGALTAPAITATAVGKTSQTIVAGSPSGGASPYTYQWYQSTAAGSATQVAVSGNAVSGAASQALTQTGLTVQSPYYYVLAVTDSAGTTVLSNVLYAPTHGATTLPIAFVGDSITAGVNSDTTPVAQTVAALQSAYPQFDFQADNLGAAGQPFRYYSTINGGGSHVTDLVTTLQAAGISYVSIMEGTNDWSQSTAAGGPDVSYTVANYLADMQNVTGYLTAHGFTVYVHQLLYRTTGTLPDDPGTGIPAWNAALNKLPYGSTLRAGDRTLYAYVKANASGLTDGLHPGTALDIAIGSAWASAMGPSLESDFARRSRRSRSRANQPARPRASTPSLPPTVPPAHPRSRMPIPRQSRTVIR